MFLEHQAHLVWHVDMIFYMAVYEKRSRETPHFPGNVCIPLEVPFAVSPELKYPQKIENNSFCCYFSCY